MTKISTYVVDEKVTALDKWIGSDANMQNRTKNFTPKKLAAYFNEDQVINIGTPLQYKYYTLDPLEARPNGTLTFETEIGPTVNFSSITTFLLSKYTTKQNIVSDFLNFLDGSKVLLFKSSDINSFGFYRISSLEPYEPDPNFFVVTVNYETGNGALEEDEDYMISLVSLAGDFIPTKTSELINDGDDGVNPFISELDINRTEWDEAYDGKINSAEVTGTTTKTLTLTKQDGGTIEASWTDSDTGLTSVGVSMPTAFSVANSPLTSNGTINITGAGTSLEYIKGDGTLGVFPTLTGYIPYTGATQDVDLGTHQLKADNLAISTTSTETVDVGEIVWNSIDGTFDMGLVGGVTLQAGQELHMYGKATEAISNGQAVMFAGVQGDHILIAKADAATINVNPEYLIGIATQDFVNNQFGYVTVFGNVRGLDTTGYTLGSVLYYNSGSSTDGLLTATTPTAPNAKIIVAAVVRVHATQGILLVRPHTMPKLKDLQDVYAPSPSSNNGLFWNSSTLRYENNSIIGALGYTPYNATNPSNYITLGSISSTATGITYTNTTGIFSLTSGYVIPTTTEESNWNDAYIDRITSASAPLSISSNAISISQAGSTTNGYLTSADWDTFNSKQVAGDYITSLTGEATASGPGAASVTLNNASVTSKILSGVNITGGTILDTDTMLTAFGKLQNQINSLIGGSIYQGVWNANTNTPTLTSSVGTDGNYYIVNVAGSTDLNGITDWKIGDWAIFHGGTWQKVDNTDAVSSVNGFTGAVSLATDSIPEGTTNLYFTNSRVSANTDVAANTASRHNAVTIGTANGLSLSTQSLSLGLASTSATGALSSTDWNTFNAKQSALNGTGFVKISGTTISYDNSTYALDNAVVKLTGDQSITGSKSFTTNTAAPAMVVTNNSTDNGILLQNTSTGRGATSNNVSTGIGIRSDNTGGGTGISSSNTGAGTGIVSTNTSTTGSALSISNSSTGYGILLTNSTGTGISSSNTGSGTGFYSNNSSTGNGIQSINSSSGYGISSSNTGSGRGIYSSNNSTGDAINIANSGSGRGIYLTNASSGKSLILNNDTAATGMPFTVSKNSVDKFTINDAGEATGVKFIKSGGTSSQFLKADGSIDSTSYQTALTNPVTGTGTTNYLPKFTGASAIGNSLIYDNGTNVGIGTTSPAAKLTINADANSNANAITIYSNNTTAQSYTSIGSYYANGNTNVNSQIRFGNENTNGGEAYLALATGSGSATERMRITSGGNVGIGTTSPNLKLSVLGANGAPASSGTTQNGVLRLSGGTGIYNVLDFGINETNDYSWIQSTRANNLAVYDKLALQPLGGNVGIGTTSPAAKLTVNTTTNENVAIGSLASIPTGRTLILQTSSSGGSIETYSSVTSGYVNTLINPNGGNVGIGTTSPNSNSNRTTLTLNNNTWGGQLDINVGGTNHAQFGTDNFNSGLSCRIQSQDGIVFNAGGATERMRITSGGSVLIGTTTDAGYKLDVNGTGRFTGVTTFNGGNIDGTLGEAILFGNASYPNSQKNRIRSSISAGVLGNLLALEAGDGTIGGYYNNQLVLRGDGNVGIGVASPRTKLDVEAYTSFMSLSSGINSEATTPDQQIGGIDFRKHYALAIGASIRLLQAGGPNNYSTSHLAFYTNNGDTSFNTVPPERMRITSGGNVGIGTTSPDQKLTVATSSFPAASFYRDLDVLSVGTAAQRILIGARKGSVFTSGASITGVLEADGNNGNIAFDTLNGGSLAERMRITSGGNVLIGTTTDAGYKLDVAGTGRVTGSLTINSATTPFLHFHSTRTSGQSGYIKDDGNMVFQKTESGGGFRFLNSSSSVLLSIDAVGASAFSNNVTITPPSNQVALRVNHSGTNGAEGSKFNSAGSGTTYGSMTMLVDSCNYGTGIRIVTGLWSASQSAMQFYSGTTSVGSISCTTSATAYNTSSDYRLKENVVPMESPINRLKELNPCRFNFINNPDKTVDGFIAHEVQGVIPEAITGEKDELDYDGSPKYQGIDQSKIVPLLTAALQEAISKIEELENRLLILENK